MGFPLNIFQLVLSVQNQNGPRDFIVRNEFLEAKAQITLHSIRRITKLNDTGKHMCH